MSIGHMSYAHPMISFESVYAPPLSSISIIDPYFCRVARCSGVPILFLAIIQVFTSGDERLYSLVRTITHCFVGGSMSHVVLLIYISIGLNENVYRGFRAAKNAVESFR